jgi:integrase
LKPALPPQTLRSVYEELTTARDGKRAHGTIDNYRNHWLRIGPSFADRPPESITWHDVQTWLDEQDLAPTTLRAYLGTLRQLLDYADVHPNPDRSGRLELPHKPDPLIVPPRAKQVEAFMAKVKPERRLQFAVLSGAVRALAKRSDGNGAMSLSRRGRILSRPEVVKGRGGYRRARWVQVPDLLIDALLDSTPPDDRTGHLFKWWSAQAVTKMMERACKAAGIPVYSPHDLRHRRISVWHYQGDPAREIGGRVGQTQISTTLDLYTHTMTPEELSDESLGALLVWSPCGLEN